MRLRVFLMALVAGLITFAPTASATLQLNLYSGGLLVTVNDDNGGFDGCAVSDCITFSGSIGTWIVNVSTGTAFAGGNPLIDLSSFNRGSGSTALGTDLTITFSGTGFVGPVSSLTSHIGGTLASGASLSYSAYVDNTNTGTILAGASHGPAVLPAPGAPLGTLIGSTQSFTNPPDISFSGDTTGGSAGAIYALTQVVTLTGTVVGSSSFDANIDPTVPEPASVALLGGILLFSVSAIRRKVRRAS